MITPEERAAAMTCPYCGGKVEYVDSYRVYNRAGFGMVYLCANWPLCTARVGCHPDGRPLGTLADDKTRRARQNAHHWFDQLWKDGQLTRSEAYRYLAQYMGGETHIGSADVETCELIIGFAKTYLGECDHV